MAKTMRCKLFGCDRNPCGVCTRCKDETGAEHRWGEIPRERPCLRLEACETCGDERTQPDHDWTPVDDDLKCSRCGLKI